MEVLASLLALPLLLATPWVLTSLVHDPEQTQPSALRVPALSLRTERPSPRNR